VLLAISAAPMRAGVRKALEADGLSIAVEAANAEEAVAAAFAQKPDVCVIATALSGGGIAAATLIRQEMPGIYILAMTEQETEEELVDVVLAGVGGYLPNSTSAYRLPYAVRSVASGEAAISRRLTAGLMRELRERAIKHRLRIPSTGREVELTPREFDVLQRLRRGLGTAGIASQLRISEITVRRHIAAIEHKLEVRDRQQVIALLGQIGPDEPGAPPPEPI
jgi:DNA-binding NarL/FixJ family response regulator